MIFYQSNISNCLLDYPFPELNSLRTTASSPLRLESSSKEGGKGGREGLFPYLEEKNEATTPLDFVCSQMRSLNESLDEAINTLSHTKESLSTKTMLYGQDNDDDSEFPVSLRLAQEKIYQIERTISQMTPQTKHILRKGLTINPKHHPENYPENYPKKNKNESEKSHLRTILKLLLLFGFICVGIILYFSLSDLNKNNTEIDSNKCMNSDNKILNGVDSKFSYEKAVQITSDKPKGYLKIMKSSDSNNITSYQKNLTGVHINMMIYIENVILSIKKISFFVKSQIFNRIRFDLRNPKLAISSSNELVVNKNNKKTSFIHIFILAFKRLFGSLDNAKYNDHKNTSSSTDLTLDQTIGQKSKLPGGVHINMLNFIENFAKSIKKFFFFIKTQIINLLRFFR